MRKQITLVRSCLTLGLAIVFAASLGAPAFAVSAPNPSPRGTGLTSASLVSEPSSQISTAAVPSVGIPSGCWGYTDLPHKSFTFASVHGRTECPKPYPMIVSINLYHSHWYGWEYLSNGYASGTLAKVNGNAKWYCLNVGTYDYLGESYHRVTIGGTNYIAYTAKTARFGC